MPDTFDSPLADPFIDKNIKRNAAGNPIVCIAMLDNHLPAGKTEIVYKWRIINIDGYYNHAMDKYELIMKAFGPHKPYIDCPFCGEKAFGVMGINIRTFWRKCGNCWKNGTPEKLPELDKKLIYLDQFAISNMMFALNKKLGKTSKVDPF